MTSSGRQKGFWVADSTQGNKGVKSGFESLSDLCYNAFMSRPLRIEYADAWYHVMNRGRRREDIFLVRDDYLRFLKVLIDRMKARYWNLRNHSEVPESKVLAPGMDIITAAVCDTKLLS